MPKSKCGRLQIKIHRGPTGQRLNSAIAVTLC